jgi:hypothetical protein
MSWRHKRQWVPDEGAYNVVPHYRCDADRGQGGHCARAGSHCGGSTPGSRSGQHDFSHAVTPNMSTGCPARYAYLAYQISEVLTPDKMSYSSSICLLTFYIRIWYHLLQQTSCGERKSMAQVKGLARSCGWDCNVDMPEIWKMWRTGRGCITWGL